MVGDAGMVCALDTAAWGRALDAARVRREELVHSGRERAHMFTAALSASDLLREYDTIVSQGKAAR